MADRSTESYGQHGTTWVDRLGVWLSQRAIRRKLPPRAALSVLELGCGYRATQLCALRDHIARGTGVDFTIAPDLKSGPGLTFHEGSIEQVIPILPAADYDVVLLISVLEHIGDPLATLKEVRRVIRPGGRLLINVPTWRGKFWLELFAFRLGLSPKVEMDDHKMYYDKRDLWPLLVRAGFRPSEISLRYHKFGLNLFAVVTRTPCDS